jgi:hypothetical protein
MGSQSCSPIAAFWTLRSSFFLRSFLLIVALFSTPSLGFASWLKCYVDLDPSEVIMYQKVVPASDAAHVVGIEVQAFGHAEDVWWSSTTTATTSTPSTDKDDDDNNNPHTNTLPLPVPFPGTPLTLRVRLRLPPSLHPPPGDHPPDIQFVVEATTSVSDAAAEAVEFIDKGVMCDGKRAFSRRHDEPVILQIDLNAHPELEYVTLVAGWASELEAVTLTPILTLIPARTTMDEGEEAGAATTTTIPPPPPTTEEAPDGGTDEL